MKTIPIIENTHTEEILKVISHLTFLDMEKGPWIAGGIARRLADGSSSSYTFGKDKHVVNADFDIFFASYQQFRTYQNLLAGTENWSHAAGTKNAKTMELRLDGQVYPIQLIKKKFYTDVQAIFDNFDFSVCKFATDGKTLVCEDGADEDLTNMYLRTSDYSLINPDYFSARFVKYLRYGFNPQPGMLSQSLKSLNGRGVSDYDGSYSGL